MKEPSPAVTSVPGTLLPSLESGDRLGRAEFHRRYLAMPATFRAELIEGVVYVAPPVRVGNHGRPHWRLATWLGVYAAGTPGTEEASDATVLLDDQNEPQPDAILRVAPELGGQSGTTEDDYIERAPELCAEVAASSASYDLHAKLDAYERNGVREYVVWRIHDSALDWFVLRGKAFVPIRPDASGVVRSEVFPGLWLDVPALLRGDMARVLECLRDGLASAEHATFVERLRRHGRDSN